MAGKQAKILTDTAVAAMLRWCDERRRYPHRDKVVVLLSVKAGLRAMEIAGLRRWHVMDAGGGIDDTIHLEDGICKKGSGRAIPMAPVLLEHVAALFRVVPGRPRDPLILSERALREDPGEPGTGKVQCMTARSIVHLFGLMYGELGLVGCSSHSGRRTFGTRAARKVVEAGGSLRDVQQLLGHKDLSTTQKYIDGSEDAKRRLVHLI
jgi:integrase